MESKKKKTGNAHFSQVTSLITSPLVTLVTVYFLFKKTSISACSGESLLLNLLTVNAASPMHQWLL